MLGTPPAAPPAPTGWALVEFIEAAAHTETTDRAFDALVRRTEVTRPSGTDWALGIQARSHALLSDGPEAERLYLEAISRLGRTGLRGELARAHLLYGEWLRRERKVPPAREPLHTAYELFTGMGMRGFAARLLLSPRTVEWQLRRIFAELGIRGREQLRWSPE